MEKQTLAETYPFAPEKPAIGEPPIKQFGSGVSNASMDDWLRRMGFVSQVWPVKDSSDELDRAGAK